MRMLKRRKKKTFPTCNFSGLSTQTVEAEFQIWLFEGIRPEIVTILNEAELTVTTSVRKIEKF